MSGYWSLMAACLLVAFHYAIRIGTQMVHSRTGRENRPAKASIGFGAVFCVLEFVIGIPPIYLMRDADPL